MKNYKFLLATLGMLLMISIVNISNAEEKPYSGTIKGRIVDADTKQPLAGANIIILASNLGAASDHKGDFIIEEVPVGNYTLQFSYIGYSDQLKTDIIVKSNRHTYVEPELNISTLESETITVKSSYFPEISENPVSIVRFSSEEIRRAPGSAGDVSRIIFGLPSIAKVNDTRNSLLVRGGAAFENSFYIDNIEIPNINHFPEQGSSGGPIGILNVEFIKDVDFYSGGFSSIYGDRLSSVMDISFREGNRDEMYGQIDLNFGGFGGVVEGPLAEGKGSWMLSARKSFLDLIVGAIGEDKTSVPNYGDIQGKIVLDASKDDKFSFIGVFGVDAITHEKESAIKNADNMYSDVRILQNTIGLNWRRLWGKSGYSNTSLSHTITKYDFTIFETLHYLQTGNEKKIIDQIGNEQEYRIRNVNHFIINAKHKFEFGLDLKMLTINYNHYYGPYHDYLGNPQSPLQVDKNKNAFKIQGFLGYTWNPVTPLTLKPGIRINHFTYNKNTTFSPQMTVSYSLTDRTSLSGTAGIYHQNLPLVLLSQQATNNNLHDPLAYHFIAGIQHSLTENTRLSVELYHKEYRNFPLDPTQPSAYVMDEVIYTGIYTQHHELVDEGKGYARGIELMIQKKLAEDFYGMASAAYFQSRYKGLDNVWRNRKNDNRFVLNIEGGYKPNNHWEFSMRWIFSGGTPYTPFDISASEEAYQGIRDYRLVNTERLPNYHSLNVRFDKRFYFKGSNLIFYLSVWNLYGRNNISGYLWNQIENKPEAQEQWSTLPIFGLEYEF